MAGIVTDELSGRINRFRDDQARVNRQYDQRILALESELEDLKHRFAVLTKFLISKQMFSAADFASMLAATPTTTVSQQSQD